MQGRALANEIDNELIHREICKDSRDCFNKLAIYGEHGNHVNFNLYDVGSGNKRVITAIVVEMIVNRGLNITGGIPIAVQAFEKSHDEYTNFKNFFSKKPAIKLEVSR